MQPQNILFNFTLIHSILIKLHTLKIKTPFEVGEWEDVCLSPLPQSLLSPKCKKILAVIATSFSMKYGSINTMDDELNYELFTIRIINCYLCCVT